MDSAGVNLPYQDGIFPGQYGAARIFYYNSLMRRKLRVPQIAAVMGPCIAGGAYLPALSDVIIMVERHQLHGPRRPEPGEGRGRPSRSMPNRSAARACTPRSAAWRITSAKDDAECLALIRQRFRELPAPARRAAKALPPAKPAEGLYDVLPADHRLPYDMEEVIARIFDARRLSRISARVRAGNAVRQRAACGPSGRRDREPARISEDAESGPRIGGIVYTESARKVAYFVENAERQRHAADLSAGRFGLHGGRRRRRREGIIRAGAEMVETMACATVPKIVLTLNHASGAGYYAMAGQGFDPNFTFSWPTARIGVMEGDSAVQALFSVGTGEATRRPASRCRRNCRKPSSRTRADYERWLDAKYAAARGHCDAVIDPLDTREV